MKIERQDKPPIVIGKRVAVGAVINSLTSILAFYIPEHAPAFVAAAVPITFIAQIIIANWIGITTVEQE